MPYKVGYKVFVFLCACLYAIVFTDSYRAESLRLKSIDFVINGCYCHFSRGISHQAEFVVVVVQRITVSV